MSNIKVGDLVVVLRGHCGPHSWTGRILTVSELLQSPWGCSTCGNIQWINETCARFHEEIGWYVCPTRYLKRIPPLEELEGQRTEERLKEPA